MSDDQRAVAQMDMVVVGAGFAGLYMIHKAQERGFSVQCFEAGDGVAVGGRGAEIPTPTTTPTPSTTPRAAFSPVVESYAGAVPPPPSAGES